MAGADDASEVDGGADGGSEATTGGSEAVGGSEATSGGSEAVGGSEAGGGASAVRGMAVRRQVLGDEHVDRAVAGTTGFTAPFQDLITRYAWGEIWSRPGLTRAERSMITLTALAALRQEEELALHVRAALRNGLTAEQIQEVLLQVAIYAGVPAANRAFAIAQRILAEVAGSSDSGLTSPAAPPGGGADSGLTSPDGPPSGGPDSGLTSPDNP
jgi:4-carboxymuconolactone decarboxylase